MVNHDSALEVTWDRTLSVWWAFFWRATVFSLLAGLILGFMGGFMVTMFGRADLGSTVGAILGWLVSFPVSIVVLRVALEKRYKSFSVKLVPLA